MEFLKCYLYYTLFPAIFCCTEADDFGLVGKKVLTSLSEKRFLSWFVVIDFNNQSFFKNRNGFFLGFVFCLILKSE